MSVVGGSWPPGVDRHPYTPALTCLTLSARQMPNNKRFRENKYEIDLRNRTRQLQRQRLRIDDAAGHESIATSQRYVDGAGTDNRKAAALNPLYSLIQSKE